MSFGLEETSPEVPDTDALEQRTPVLPKDSQEWTVTGHLPDDVPQADFIDQHKAVQPASADYEGVTASEAEADEGDLIEGNMGPAGDDEDDYPDARDEGV